MSSDVIAASAAPWTFVPIVHLFSLGMYVFNLLLIVTSIFCFAMIPPLSGASPCIAKHFGVPGLVKARVSSSLMLFVLTVPHDLNFQSPGIVLPCTVAQSSSQGQN